MKAGSEEAPDDGKFADDEGYSFGEVTSRFASQGCLVSTTYRPSRAGRQTALVHASPPSVAQGRALRRFVEAVRASAPAGYSLRDYDRLLWGRSRRRDLQQWLASPALAPQSLLKSKPSTL